jgi:hypothetical protein
MQKNRSMTIKKRQRSSIGSKYSKSTMQRYKFLDLSGYMFSGKAAAIDLVREFNGYSVPDYRYEFPLIRVQDGIMDLEKALIDDWSPIRSDAAIKRFMKLIKKLSNSRRKISLKDEELVGWDFDSRYAGKFYELASEYAESLVSLRTRAPWPYSELDQSFYELVIRLLLPRVQGWKLRIVKAGLMPAGWISGLIFPKYREDLKKLTASITDPLGGGDHGAAQDAGFASYSWQEVDLFIASGEKFYELTRDFLERLLSINIVESNVHTIVMHNAFEPFNPWRPVRYFRDAKCIVVDRDPRDIYVNSCTFSKGYNDNPNVYGKISFSDDIGSFIKRFEILRKKTNTAQDPPGKVLRMNFEKLVLEYDKAVKIVYRFLGENERTHARKREFFNPDLSRKNVGLWKKHPHQTEIKRIHEELKDYCIDT